MRGCSAGVTPTLLIVTGVKVVVTCSRASISELSSEFGPCRKKIIDPFLVLVFFSQTGLSRLWRAPPSDTERASDRS
jgi:hypothetical protein